MSLKPTYISKVIRKKRWGNYRLRVWKMAVLETEGTKKKRKTKNNPQKDTPVGRRRYTY